MNRMGRFIAVASAMVMVTGWPAAAAQDGHDHDDHGHEEAEPHDDHGDPETHAEPDQDVGHDDYDEHGDVALSPAELAEFGIEVVSAGPGRIETYVSLPGEVRPNADRLAHIVPRYAGIVTEVRANVGDRVKKGQVLAIVESDESLAPFEVTTLLSGTVISKHIALGEAVSRDRDIFVIADLSTVWVDLTVYQRDVSRVATNQRARIFVGHELAEDVSTISYVTPVVDERTRTATARVVLSNARGVWRPGMFVTGKVLIESTDVAVAVPRTALHTLESRSVVFVETDGGFRPQPVVTGRNGEAHVEITSGLTHGDRYVSHGGFTLKAELGKESFGDGHAH